MQGTSWQTGPRFPDPCPFQVYRQLYTDHLYLLCAQWTRRSSRFRRDCWQHAVADDRPSGTGMYEISPRPAHHRPESILCPTDLSSAPLDHPFQRRRPNNRIISLRRPAIARSVVQIQPDSYRPQVVLSRRFICNTTNPRHVRHVRDVKITVSSRTFRNSGRSGPAPIHYIPALPAPCRPRQEAALSAWAPRLLVSTISTSAWKSYLATLTVGQHTMSKTCQQRC